MHSVVLQKLLSLYHPDRDVIFYEEKPVAVATDEIAWLEMEIEALNAARDIDFDSLDIGFSRLLIGIPINILLFILLNLLYHAIKVFNQYG